MCGKGGCAKAGGHECREHKAHAHKQVFGQNAARKPKKAFERFQLGHKLMGNDIVDAHKAVYGQQRAQAHAAGHHRAQHRGQRRTANAQRGKAPMPADQQVVAAHIHNAAGHIGGHGNAGVAAAPLGGVDAKRNHIEHHAAHNDLKIRHGIGVSVGLAAAKVYNGPGQSYTNGGDHRTGCQRKCERGGKNMPGAVTVALAAAAGHQSRNRNIGGYKKRKAQKFGLHGKAYGGHRRAAQTAYHQGVDHTGQRHKKAFQHGRPRHAQGLAHQTGGMRCIALHEIRLFPWALRPEIL